MTVLQRLEGSAYRDGQLVCARAAVTVVADASSARRVRVRFVEGVDDRLRDELERLMARRGAFATRCAERLDPLEIVGRDADDGLQWRLVGRLEQPAAHYWPRTDTEFWLRECSEPGAVRRSSQTEQPAQGRAHALRLLRVNLAVEQVVLLAVVLITAILIRQNPGG